MRAVAGPGRSIDDAELGHLIETLQNAGSQSARMRRIAARMRYSIENSGLDVDREYRTDLLSVQSKPDHGRARRDCSSGDPAEAVDRYGYSKRLQAALEQPLDRNSSMTSAFSF